MKKNRFITAPLWLAVGSATLGQTFVAPGVTVADVGLALASGLIVLDLARRRCGPVFPRWLRVVALWLAWSLVGGSVRLFSSPFPFSEVEFLKSATKLGFYAVAAWLLTPLICRLEEERTKDVVLWVLAGNAGIALYIYLAMTSGWELPYRFFWIGGEDAAHALSWGGAPFDQPLVRARGVAAEPSYFGLFQVLGLAVSYGGSKFGVGRHRWREAMVLVSVVLTFSLGVYLLLAVMVSAVAVVALRRGKPVVRRAVIPTLLLVAALAAVPKVRESAADLVVYRLAMVTSGAPDTSVELRTRVNATVAWKILRQVPLVGAGLGNFEFAWGAVRGGLGAASEFPPEQGWNGLLYAIATTGVIGGGLFLLLLWTVWRVNPAGGAVLAASLFATSAILAAPFWIVLVLLAASPEPSPPRSDTPPSRTARFPG